MRRNNRIKPSSYIPLTEFLFYNKTKKIIDEHIIDDIKTRLLKSETENEIFWSNDTFSKLGIGFSFKTQLTNQQDLDFSIDIIELQKTFTREQFCNCKKIINKEIILTFDVTKHQLEILKNLNLCTNVSTIEITVINDWNTLINLFIESKIICGYKSKNHYEAKKFNEDINILFDTNIELNEPKYCINNSYGLGKVVHILKVIEKRINNVNYRIALLSEINSYDYCYFLDVIKEDDKRYNYIDENNMYFSSRKDNMYFLTSDLLQYRKDEIYVDKKVFKLMYENIDEVLGENSCVITPTIYRFYNDRVLTFNNNVYEPTNEKEIKIIKQFTKLLSEKREIKIDNVLITNNKIQTLDGEFIIEFKEDFLNVQENFGDIRKTIKSENAKYNFNILYEKLLGLSALEKIITTPNIELKQAIFKVNNIDIEVTRDNGRVKINGIFSRISDVYYILTKAICYRDVNEYEKYIKDVSYIGIDWKKMISNGLIIEIGNPFYNIFKKTGENSLEKLYMRISLLWDLEKRSNVFLLLNGKEYLIKYKGKFKKLFDYPRRTITMSKLKNELNECIENLDDNTFIEIVENGIKEAKIVVERGQELVRLTVSDIKGEDTFIDVRSHKINGYKFKGRISKSDYFVDKMDLTVYKYMEGSWNRRCVVDDHNKQRIFEDRLANRLINIYNEPAKIYTIHN